MLTKIIEWSGKNPFLVLLATLFIVIGGVVAVLKTPLDALPDLSDVQVIVYTEYPGQAPQVVEDQVTYPLTTAMLAVPKSKVVRGFSFFGASFVYVIFEDGTDIYWARTRVLEYLNFASGRLPKGVTPTLGPDATGVGWVYQYVVLAKDRTLAELRTIQDWYVRYQLTKAQGVAEVASIGGFVQTYQVTVDPVKLRSYGIPLAKVTQVIRDSNRDVGGRVIEMAETEYMVRGKGYLRGKSDIELLVVKSMGGTPVLIRDIARVEMAPDERRGLTELNGEGEVVSGIAMARYGQNALEVISNLKDKVKEISGGLPEGVTIQAVYDRSDLIHRAIDTLKRTLIEESLIVAAVCIVFLLHVRSALVAILMLPVGVLISFIAMRLLGMNSNLMSLGGIAIAIGAMVDAAIVMIENAHKHLERLQPGHTVKERAQAMLDACKEVGPALFFSLLIITVSFLPVFTLESQEGRLFSPLAYTKTFSMAGAALLSVTLVPVLMMLFIRGKIMPEARNPVNRFLIWIYRPIIAWVMRWKKLTIASGRHRHGRLAVSGIQAGQRVHAHAQRRHAAVHAGIPARHVDHQGRRGDADPGQDHQELSRGGVGLRQGRTRQHRHRSGAGRDVRDGDQPQAAGAMARGHDHRQADRRDGPGAAVPGHFQRLDHADQGPHRHAVHRHPHADRHQGVRQGPGRDGAAGQGDRGRGEEGARHHLAPSPNASPAAAIWTSSPTASSWPAMACRWANCRM